MVRRSNHSRDEVHEPIELALVRKAFDSGLSNCVMWKDDRTMRRIETDELEETGLTATAVKKIDNWTCQKWRFNLSDQRKASGIPDFSSILVQNPRQPERDWKIAFCRSSPARQRPWLPSGSAGQCPFLISDTCPWNLSRGNARNVAISRSIRPNWTSMKQSCGTTVAIIAFH